LSGRLRSDAGSHFDGRFCEEVGGSDLDAPQFANAKARMTCDVCRSVVEKDDVIEIGGRVVCAVCKPRLVRQLAEGVAASDLQLLSENELSVGSILALTWTMFRRDWGKILTLTIVIAIVMHFLALPFEAGEAATLREMARSFRMYMLIEIVIGVVGRLGIAWIVQERIAGREVSFGGAFKHAMNRWGAGAWTEFVANFVIGLMTLAFIVPGVIWLVFYSFTTCAVSLRSCAGDSALRYSKRLVRGRWWRVAGRMLALFAISAVLPIVAGALMVFLPENDGISLVVDLVTEVPFAFFATGVVVVFSNLDAVSNH
jgi:hypothetical protein